LKDAADEHRRIYLAIRANDPDRARRMMSEHLMRAEHSQRDEDSQPMEAVQA
jgi:DNA-binding FadR family transcriptional regulator